MATVKSLSIANIRSHTMKTLDLSPGVTVITGPNGSGKTTLLEGIVIALQGTSFKGSDNDILRHGEPWWKIQLEFDDDTRRVIKFDPSKTSGRKQFVIDSKTQYRLTPKYKRPIVLFEPEDLRLLHGSPSRRRDFIDRFITQLDPHYGTHLRQYERALRQRNALLKRFGSQNDQLFVWDIALAEHGSYVIEQRLKFIDTINTHIQPAYEKIASSGDSIQVSYSHSFGGDIKGQLLRELQARIDRDALLGNTSVGPHRHDVLFTFNNSPALTVVSRGEARTVVLALKFLEVSIIEKLTGKKPIILFDDVFSELDITRQKALSETIKTHQIVITSTHVVSESDEFLHVTL